MTNTPPYTNKQQNSTKRAPVLVGNPAWLRVLGHGSPSGRSPAVPAGAERARRLLRHAVRKRRAALSSAGRLPPPLRLAARRDLGSAAGSRLLLLSLACRLPR